MTIPYILICHCTSLSSWFIILDNNNFETFLITTESRYEPLCIVCWYGDLRGVFFLQIYSRRSHRDLQKFIFFPYKQVSGRNGDHEWLRMTNAFILCDLLWKVQKGHVANREGSFKLPYTPLHHHAFCILIERTEIPYISVCPSKSDKYLSPW